MTDYILSGTAWPGAGTTLTFRGAWDVATAYAVDDVVTYGGASYAALLPGTGQQPDLSPTYWSLLAAAGAPGATGPAGADAVPARSWMGV